MKFGKNDKPFCVTWNRGVCKTKDCEKWNIHACNVNIGGGKPCYDRSHKACNHWAAGR